MIQIATRTTCLGALLIVFASCQQSLSRKELLDYTFDVKNGLYKMEDKDGVLVEVVYRPSQLVVEQEIRGRHLKETQIDSIEHYFHGFDYFLLRLSKNKKEIETSYARDPQKFNYVNNYLSFAIGKDIYLVNGQDTVRATDFIHTRTFGSSPSSDILIAFKNGSNRRNQEVNFIFDDSEFGTGFNKFSFARSDIQSLASIYLIEKSL